MLDLSVIIVNWNTRDLLMRCLASLHQYTQGISYEVFVVDNGSTDGSPEMVKQKFPAVCLIANRDNVGFPKANNQAIREAKGRYILLLNSDTALAENAFQKMVGFMDNHPAVGIIGTKLLNPDGSRQYSCDCFPRSPIRLVCDRFLDLCYPGNSITRQKKIAEWNYDTNFVVDSVVGAVLLIRRATFEEIGLLDEQFFMYAEDIDWCYRAALAGWKIYYLGEISIYHDNRGSSEPSSEVASRLQKMRAQSLVKFYRKHYGTIAASIINGIIRTKQIISSRKEKLGKE